MQPAEAEVLLRATELARRRTHSQLHQSWLPLVLFGGLTLASAGVAAVAPGWTVGLFWLVGGPAGTLATGLWYWRRHHVAGVSTRPWPSVAAGLGLLVAAQALGGWGRGSPLASAGVLVVVGAGYAAFAALERSLPLAAFAAAAALGGAALAAAQPAHAYEIATATSGATAVGLGLLLAGRS
jgi:hypothetical protein